MIFEEKDMIKNIGEKIGFISAYLFFTTILFLIMSYLNRFPGSWTYFNVMGVTFLVTLVGSAVRRLLK
jgi:hypothetical protein